MRTLPDHLRAFVAIRLSLATETAIAHFIENAREQGAAVAWVRSPNLHMTLRFLGGAVPAAMLASLDIALNQISARTTPFSIRARGSGAFPHLDRPRVLWVGLQGEPLIELAEAIETAARDCGFVPERRAFAPHLTIGRVRHLRGWLSLRTLLKQQANQEFSVSLIDEMILYQSELQRGGAVYQELACYRFSRSFEP